MLFDLTLDFKSIQKRKKITWLNPVLNLVLHNKSYTFSRFKDLHVFVEFTFAKTTSDNKVRAFRTVENGFFLTVERYFFSCIITSHSFH